MDNRLKLGSISLASYISQNFTKAFLTIFLPLFFIGSLVFIIKLSTLTSHFQVNFWEMAQLFAYNLPVILFYTLPISFLVAIAIALLRLSNENELMALIALGIPSRQLLRQLWLIGLLFTILLLVLSLIQIPQAEQQYQLFKARKATEAQLNINPSELGQKFGDFFIYIKSKQKDTLKDVVIYKRDTGSKENNLTQFDLSNQLFISKEAQIVNKDATIELSLRDGHGYTFEPEALKEITYQEMQLTKRLQSAGYSYKNIIEHWINYAADPKKSREILFYIFISLIPLMGLKIIAAYSIINPRYQKNYAYVALGITVVMLYVIATSLKNQGNPIILLIAILTIFAIGHYLFRRHVTRYF